MPKGKAEVELSLDKTTKRMYRFKEEGEENLIGTLYLNQKIFDSEPKKIKVTVEQSE